MIDLHCHSTRSDGALPPAELARRAAAGGLLALALTDHDTTAGWSEFRAAALRAGVRPVPGVEASAVFPGGALHLLGHLFRPADRGLQALLLRLREGREARNREILDKLAGLGLPLSPGELEREAAGGVPGRPHIARALVARGHVRRVGEAFARYLERGKPAYAERYRCAPAEFIRVVHRAGGVVSLAHPGSLGLSAAGLAGLLEALCAEGLDGIEARYPEHPPALERRLEDLARRFDLVPTGGSDFHDPRISCRLGHGRAVPLGLAEDTLDRLEARAMSRAGRG